MINSAHLENHLADGQRFDVLGVNIFAHLRVRDPIVEGTPSVAQSEFVDFVGFVGFVGFFCGVENLSLPLSRHGILSGATNP